MMQDFARMSAERKKAKRHEQVVLDLDFAAQSLRGKGSLILPVSGSQHSTRQSQISRHSISRHSQASFGGASHRHSGSVDRHSAFDSLAGRQSILDLQSSVLEEDDQTETSSSDVSSARAIAPNRVAIMTSLVMLLGAIGASIFVGYGIRRVALEEEIKFGLQTEEVAVELEVALMDYERGAKWLHQACSTHHVDRAEFRKIYEYISSSIETLSIQWMPKVYHEQRAQLENESMVFYDEFYPHLNYAGIIGVEPDDRSPEGSSLQPRSDQPFYYPLHYVEPVETNEAILEFDAYSSDREREVIDRALQTWQPAVSEPFKIRQQTSDDTSDNSILLFHPGIPLSHVPDQVPRDIAVLVVQVKSILKAGTRHLPHDMSVYVYSATGNSSDYHFVVAAELHVNDEGDSLPTLVFLPETSYSDILDSRSRLMEMYDIEITPTSRWVAVFVPLEGTYEPSHQAVLAAGVFIVLAAFVVAFWLRADMIRIRKLQETRRQAEAEKAAVTVKSARQAARQEQELNDYIAHEVRNPLAAAMSACSFVKSAVEERQPLKTEESITSVREDVAIIDTSLAFMNDLLRSMLDMHKAASKKMKVDVVPVDVLQDIILPVASMLYQRSSTFEVMTECQENLFVLTDRMRLKQIMLNLGRNSSKFVEQGFILLGASIEDGSVRLVIEDSGPGISKAKQKRLFSKFQESLDLTNQGTGMGLCLCKNLIDLMGGDIRLDPSYESGISGCPGTKFVIDLKTPQMTNEEYNHLINPDDKMSAVTGSTASATVNSIPEEKPVCTVHFVGENEGEVKNDPRITDEDIEAALPETYSVLFVDDDLVLRKLFTRSVRKVVSGWDIKEAANGETALRMVETETFDLIFMDQYMASVEKQLLGTEATRALRAKGVKSLICGLSANDVAEGFKQAGANDFLFKPFPCKPDELRRELVRIINGTGI